MGRVTRQRKGAWAPVPIIAMLATPVLGQTGTAPTPTPPPSAEPLVDDWLWIALIVVAAAVAIVFVLRRRN